MSVVCSYVSMLLPVSVFAADVGVLDQVIGYVYAQQQNFHRELAGAIRAVQEGGLVAVWGLIGVSFLYGVLHAAGPGHGKAIIATYVATHESQLKRAITLSFATSLMQGVSAIVIVMGLMAILERQGDVQVAVKHTEQASFLLITLIGFLLMYQALKAMFKKKKHPARGGHICSSCGHAHVVSPAQITPQTSWWETLAIIFSVGIRPCSGAVLVLVFASMIWLHVASIGAVLAISLGTAITVSALTFLTVYCRKVALFISHKAYSQRLEQLLPLVSLCGGLMIVLFGVSLFMQSVYSAHPLF